MRLTVFFLLGLLAACSTAPKPGEPALKPAVQAAKPHDLSSRFPDKNRVDMRLVEDHVLGKAVLPGGNVASYKSGKKEWRLFLVRSKNAESAAILLLDFKSTLANPKYLGAFGGYFGTDGPRPMFVLQKGPYLAGITGLSEKEADPIAREFAARLN